MVGDPVKTRRTAPVSSRPEAPDRPRYITTDGAKFMAGVLLADRITRHVLVPSREEWVGLCLLDRDGELPCDRS